MPVAFGAAADLAGEMHERPRASASSEEATSTVSSGGGAVALLGLAGEASLFLPFLCGVAGMVGCATQCLAEVGLKPVRKISAARAFGCTT